MPAPSVSPFSPEVVSAVVAHMNGDHPDDNVLIVRALGGHPEATDVVMTGFDEQGARFAATVDGHPVEAVVPWAVAITERATIRQEVVRMYHEACSTLGVEPRPAAEH